MRNNIFLKSLMVSMLFATGMPMLKADVIYALPLKGKEFQIGNLLEWATANEFNSKVFVVERSMDGIDFEEIGEISAAGHSDETSEYRFMDIGINDEKALYRLRQIDTDDTESYSQTVMVKKQMSNNFMILSMSNTVTNDRFTVAVDALIDDEIQYSVKNLDGDIIFEEKEQIIFGINDITISLKDEPEGIYFITLQVKEEIEKLTIRKVDEAIVKKENVASTSKNIGG